MDFAPDYPQKTPDILTSISDFVPTLNDTYAIAPAPTTEAFTTPVVGQDVLGAFIGVDTTGTRRLFAGTSAKLLKTFGASSWTDLSGTAYAGSNWCFTQYQDRTIAANGVDKLQSSSSGGSFADLSSTAPRAKIVFAHQEALVALNVNGGPANWYRSDTGDPTNWTKSGSNDVDTGVFSSGTGGCTAGREWNGLALAWKADQMFRGIYVGSLDEKIRWDQVGSGFGCVALNAHIATEVGVIFVSNRDILLYDGTIPRSIADKVRKAFFSNLSPAAASHIFLTHNEIRRQIYIWIPTSSGVVCNGAWVYNYRTGKWGQQTNINDSAQVFSFSSISCPVVGANYADYTAIGGATNTGLDCNVVFAKPTGGAKLVNFSNVASRGSPATLVSGYFGDPTKDQTLSRVLVMKETAGTADKPSALSVDAYVEPSMLNVRTVTGSIDDYGNGNCNARGKYFRATFTWASSAAAGTEYSRMIPQFLAPGGGR